MQFTTVRNDGRRHAARVEGDELVLLPFRDVSQLLESGPDWRDRAAKSTGPTMPLAEADFAPLTPAPEKIVCVGLNYRDHAEENDLEVPQHPTLFSKFTRSLIGPYDELELPAASDAIDWELELGVVIGKTVRHAGEDEARAAIAGYTIVNDVSMRDWQNRTSQFLAGKTFESTTPVGPFLVTPEEVDDARSLEMRLEVDGHVMQHSSTDQLVFSVNELIAYVSTIITLVPGDLIATGTPAGVGHARTPPVYLEAGNVITCTIEGLGSQETRCVAPLRTESLPPRA